MTSGWRMTAIVQFFGRRHDERHLALGRPASKNLHKARSRGKFGAGCAASAMGI
jgi:hypothetical protein